MVEAMQFAQASVSGGAKLKAVKRKSYNSLAELSELINYEMNTTRCVENSEQHQAI